MCVNTKTQETNKYNGNVRREREREKELQYNLRSLYIRNPELRFIKE